MTEEMLNEMENKAMTALYNAVCRDNKVTTVQGMCDVIMAIHKYRTDHYQKHYYHKEEDVL